MLRDDLNAILSFIGSTSLTDAEFDDILIEDASDNHEVYLTLATVLKNREGVSTMGERLLFYFAAKGENFAPTEGKSNIFLGGSLCK